MRLSYLAERMGVSRSAIWIWTWAPLSDERRAELEAEVRRIGDILETALKQQ